MKIEGKLLLSAAAGMLFVVASAPSASGQTRSSIRVNPLAYITNAVPESVFEVPTNTAGRDPFFPRSRRHSGVEKAAPAPTITLVYNGLSGTADKPLAIINGRTLAEGEQTELRVGGQRIPIRCISIKGETVVVEMQGQQIELKLGAKKK